MTRRILLVEDNEHNRYLARYLLERAGFELEVAFDGKRGLALLNRGLPEYEVLPDRRTLALTLFRAVNWIARPDLTTRIGDAGPMIATPDAQCLRTIEFDYALVPHAGDWRAGRVTSWAGRFNTDLLVMPVDSHPERLYACRFALGLTQRAAGAQIGVGEDAWREVEAAGRVGERVMAAIERGITELLTHVAARLVREDGGSDPGGR